MKCDQCNEDEVMAKKRSAPRYEWGPPAMHHECRNGHSWHATRLEDDTRVTQCGGDCELPDT
jgi:hypothetical protein